MIQIATAIAAIAAAAVAIWQTRMTKQQMDATMRPWIGCQSITPLDTEVRIELHNYGSLPTLEMNSKTVATTDPVTIEKIMGAKFARKDVGIILPSQSYTHFIDVDLQPYLLARTGRVPMHLGFLLSYEYGRKKFGEYGFIAKYDPLKEGFVMLKEWGKPIPETRVKS